MFSFLFSYQAIQQRVQKIQNTDMRSYNITDFLSLVWINTVGTVKILFQKLASAVVKKSNPCTAHQLILELSLIWLKLSLIWLMERDKMTISQGNNHHPQTEAPLCQRTNGWSALYGTSPHAIWSIVSCGHFVSCPATQKAKEWKKHLSMCRSSCHRWPEGKYFELVNWLPESDGRYYSHWQERVSRGARGGGSKWAKAWLPVTSEDCWYNPLTVPCLLQWAGWSLSRPAWLWTELMCSSAFTHEVFFIEWMAAAGNFMIVSTGVDPENVLTMPQLHTSPALLKAVASGIAVHWCCSRLCSGLKPAIFL